MSGAHTSRPGRSGNGSRSAPQQPGACFVNPYTFVPLPELPELPDEGAGFRRAPAGHGLLGAGRYSGRIEVALTARSPLLVRGVRSAEAGFPRRVFPESGAEAVPFLPGSSLAGSVRSLYEVLAGGCLRVFDAGFRPGYRDAAKARNAGWKLAVVARTEHGRPRSMRVCTEVVWVDSALLAQVLGSPEKVVTGAEVRVTGWYRHHFFNRLQADEADQVKSGTGWVVLVTDGRVREGNRKCHTYWCAVGRLPDPAAPELAVTDGAWGGYLAAAAGADDVRVARAEGRLDTEAPVAREVEWRGAVVGSRHEVRPHLHPGQVVWAQVRGTPRQVTGISLASIWRHPGEYPAGERVPGQLLPCTDPEALCPACRVFGSADTGGANDAGARQASYRGHVRFGDARPLGAAVATSRVRLAPLGAPNPGAGQFYLVNDPRRKPSHKDDRPLREWGSPADRDGAPRRVRGRKQYWLTGRHTERPYFRARKGVWEGEMAEDAEQVDAGARFTFTVFVDGLSAAELGGLLAALDPSLLFGEGTGYAVGGGKPLGFGTCTAEVTACDLTDAAARYTGAPPHVPSAHDALAAFREEVPPQVRDTWEAARAALTVDRVEPGTVWYPPEKPIPAGELHVDDLAPGLGGFWKHSRGEELENSTRPLTSLPRATMRDQSLPVLDSDGDPSW